MIKNKALKRRIVEISYKLKLGHIGSCLTAVDIIQEIYDKKKPDEKFVLSSGHAGLALYCVIEKYHKHKGEEFEGLRCGDAEKIFAHHGVHPDRCGECALDCSAGSLGHGLPIAAGMALADRTKNVYCLLSDGECAEGSIYEALRIIKEQKLSNLKIYINANGHAAYKQVDPLKLKFQLSMEYGIPDIDLKITDMNDYPKWIQGQIAHYKVLNKDEYEEMIEVLK